MNVTKTANRSNTLYTVEVPAEGQEELLILGVKVTLRTNHALRGTVEFNDQRILNVFTSSGGRFFYQKEEITVYPKEDALSFCEIITAEGTIRLIG